MLQENKGDRATFQEIPECWLWERLSFSAVLSQQSTDCLWTYGNKHQIPPFLLTNTLHCSEIPHLGYKGQHGCMFFHFVEVDNELSHLVTTVLQCPFFFESLSCAALCIQVDVSALDKMGFWISVLCHIVHSSRCEHTLQPLLSGSHWHFARPG